jgi:hypothetical protein
LAAETIAVATGMVRAAATRKGMAHDGGDRRGPDEVQLRFATRLTFEEYVMHRGWESATLSACPLCEAGTCSFERLGTYMRKVPAVAYVARYYCPEQRTSFGLLPDFYASRMPGTLDALEEAAAKAEASESVEKAADELRPADAEDAVTLGAAVCWLRLRVIIVRATLVTVIGLMPDRFRGASPRVRSFRERLGTLRVLVALRGICERHLHALPAPLGLNPRRDPGDDTDRARPQSPGPDPPAARR